MTKPTDNVAGLTEAGFAGRAFSESPAPSGGAVAGVVAGLAAALAGMAGRFALKCEPHAVTIAALVNRADELRLRCCDLADADSRAYAAFTAAQQVSVDDGGKQRQMSLHAASAAAAQVPLELTGTAREIAAIGLKLVTEGSPQLQSDACAAALFASAAATASAILAGINITADTTDSQLTQARNDVVAAADAARRAAAAFNFFDPEVI